MTVKYLTDIKEFLERNVAPKISLRGIADKDARFIIRGEDRYERIFCR